LQETGFFLYTKIYGASETAKARRTRMATYRYKHLTLDDRITIQKGLKEGQTFAEIAALIGKDPSTVSKEVRGHLIIKETGTRSRPFNPCMGRKICTIQRKVCAKCIQTYDIYNREGYCSMCGRCNDSCPDFIEEKCKTLSKPPYVCNSCKTIRSCTLRKQTYDAKEAQKAYEEKRRDSRVGIDLTPEELQRLDEIISPLILQGQSIHQICVNNADDIMCDERSIYNYVDAGVLSVGNIDLPRKVRYRKRRKKKVVHVDKLCHVGRTYADFQKFIEAHPDLNVVEMDSVEGTRDSLKVLLTLFFRNSSLMLAFLRSANTARSVTDIFNALYDKLGRELFIRMFPVILTDRGSEFTDPTAIEFDKNGNRRTYVFYCDAQKSSQKGSIEVTHEFIRRILPKGKSFKNLTQAKVDLMMSHINSYSRKKLNDRSAYQLFSFFYGKDTLDTLNIRSIDANDIILKPELLTE
jgi:IS30 family transposase